MTDVDRVHCSLLLASSGVDELDNLLSIEMQVNARHIERRLLLGSGVQDEDLAIRALNANRTLLSGMLQECAQRFLGFLIGCYEPGTSTTSTPALRAAFTIPRPCSGTCRTRRCPIAVHSSAANSVRAARRGDQPLHHGTSNRSRKHAATFSVAANSLTTADNVFSSSAISLS